MAAASIPVGGITLHGAGGHDTKEGSDNAVLFRMGNGMLQDIKKASGVKNGLEFVTGNTPKLRIGGRTIDLTLSADDFRNELYVSTVAGSLAKLEYACLVSHRAVLKPKEKRIVDNETGTDEALAALQSSMKSFEQERQANQAHIESALLPVPKDRFDAAKRHKRMTNGGIRSGSLTPSHPPQRDLAPTSAPVSEVEVKLQAMRVPLIHLLAMRPASADDIHIQTRIPKTDLDDILLKLARKVDGKWQLTDRAYKDLDVWKFGYKVREDRQLAIDNAIRAYDRLRIGKEEKIWQSLLPKEDRGKGTILSRLHLGVGARSLTPNPSGTPLQSDAAADSNPPSAANTPRVGASTTRPGSSKGDVMKRILTSKDPKKAMALHGAKEKKRKEKEAAREAAASDREGAKPSKRQTAAKKVAGPAVKSAEFVQSSDESGEEGEVRDPIERVDSKTDPAKSKAATTRPNAASKDSPSPDSSDAPSASRGNAASSKKNKPADPAKSIAALATKAKPSTAAAGKVTPCTTNGLSAPSSQHKSSRSPQKQDSKPNVPSPLGAARPRVASDVSNRSAVGIQRTNTQSGGTPQGLGITNGIRKRHDTVTSTDSVTSSGSDKKRKDEQTMPLTQKPNGVSKPMPNGTPNGITNGVKRKAAEQPADDHAPKHRKTASTSSQSQIPHKSSSMNGHSTSHTSPDAVHDGGASSDNSAASVLDSITYTQGVTLAEKFRDQYYPAYAAMYDAQAGKEAKGEEVSKEERERLWAMHKRLEQMKREIRIASEREHREE